MLDTSAARISRQPHARLTVRSSAASLAASTHRSSDDKGARNSISRQCSSDDDNVSRFFAIETRLALQERLVALQQQLRELLVRTKLAWMKCFAATDRTDSDSENANTTTSTSDALDAAHALVTQGEALMRKLERAFTIATATTSCPIHTYSELVESAEQDFAAYKALVERIAQQSFPVAHASGGAGPTTRAAAAATAKASSSLGRHAPQAAAARAAQYDLPSMQSYCAKVAPPYSSYLPVHKATKSHKA